LKQLGPVLKEPNASFTTRKNKARERKERDPVIRTTVEDATLVLFLLMFLNLGLWWLLNFLNSMRNMKVN
jgi:hypothetical protein